MSAVLKENEVETKSLAEILVISDEVPADFYKNTEKYQAEIDTAIEHAKSLVHPITDEGRKLAKSDAALIRKFAKTQNSRSLEIFRSLTDKVKNWRDVITGKTKLLELEADNIMARFEEHEANILKGIRATLKEELALIIEQCKEIRPEFLTDYDVEPLVKLTGTLTPGGKLTSKAFEALRGFVLNDLQKQHQHDKRILTIENRCLRADINPPLGKVHFGDAAFWADEQIFESKLEELVTAEIARRVEMEMRIEADLKKKEQAKIDEALAQERERIRQEEQARIAQETPKVEPVVVKEAEPTPEELRARAREIKQCAEYADRNEDRNREIAAAEKLLTQSKELEAKAEELKVLSANNKKLVTITATFQVSVRESISIEAVENHFKSKLSDDLKAILTTCKGV